MVLRRQLSDSVDGVVTLVEYHPYWATDELGNRVRNSMRDANTTMIMDLKGGDARTQARIVKELAGRLEPNIEDDVVVCVVPSHDPAVRSTGIRKLGMVLARGKRTDGTGCLVRHKKVEKKSTGGSRDERVDLESIRVENPELVVGRAVLLLDDVTTTGGSMEACRLLLREAGARYVQGLAIGRTVR